MDTGIFAFFGVTSAPTLSVLESYGRIFNMPYVTPSSPTNRSASLANAHGYVLHMRPTYDLAMVDIIRHYKWPEVFYIYDNDEGERVENYILFLFFSYTIFVITSNSEMKHHQLPTHLLIMIFHIYAPTVVF